MNLRTHPPRRPLPLGNVLPSSAYREIGSKYVSSEIHERHSCVCTSEDITGHMGSNTYERHFEFRIFSEKIVTWKIVII